MKTLVHEFARFGMAASANLAASSALNKAFGHTHPGQVASLAIGHMASKWSEGYPTESTSTTRLRAMKIAGAVTVGADVALAAISYKTTGELGIGGTTQGIAVSSLAAVIAALTTALSIPNREPSAQNLIS